tara:strand:- start:1772 stop:2068 length:297 start_codon:yes stop_codon:yes gene_type:complete
MPYYFFEEIFMKKLIVLIAMLFGCASVEAQQPTQNVYNAYVNRPNIYINGTRYNSRLEYYQRLQKKRQEYYKKLQQQRFYQMNKRRYGGFGSFITNWR